METVLGSCISLFVSLPSSNYKIESTTSSRTSLLLLLFGSFLGFPKKLLQGTLEAIFDPTVHPWCLESPLNWNLQNKLKACSLLVARLSSSSITEKTIENESLPAESLKQIKRSLETITKIVYGSAQSSNYHEIRINDSKLNEESEDFTRIKLEILILNVMTEDTCLLEHGKFMLDLLESCTIHDPSLKSKLYIYDQNQLMNISNTIMTAKSTVTVIC
jgi:hypothetical protein